MAELVSSKQKIKLRLDSLQRKEKDDSWFSSILQIFKNDNIIAGGTVYFHLNDIVDLVEGLQSIVNNTSIFFIFEPIEPYVHVTIYSSDEQFLVHINFNEGPVFEPSKYQKITMANSREELLSFLEQIKDDLFRINPKFEYRKVKL